MTQRFDVCIRGGGIVGSTLALLLSQQRLRVALCVKPPSATGPDGHSDIRAYALNAASRRLLEAVRAWPDTPMTPEKANPVTPVYRMTVNGDQGGQLAFDADEAGESHLNWIVDVPALEARLAEALRFQGHVHVFTDDAPPPACALTVICEGRRSATRAEWGMTYDVTPYPHHAVAARLTLAEPHGCVARQWFSNGDIIALLPLGGEQGHDAALVWSVPADKATQLLQMEANAFIESLATGCGMAPDSLVLTHAPQSWPLELSQARDWVKPGVALAGDAAHAMHPLAGQGLNVGLGDAAELNRVLQDREYWREL
ncbi:MAG: FAD-dependent monooxygenase, partial [Burkholderiales bacterium]|nr:FAD-dependent monooxygenase [Burkholderiales bacterium]